MQFTELEALETLAVAQPLTAAGTEALIRPLPFARGQFRLATAIRDIAAVPWLLLVVLGVQAMESLQLIWSNTAFLDEATYIWAGRIELWHLANGMPVPPYPTYFSGAPVIYPPLAGLADIIGGLPAVRMLSLAFMLGATCTLWGSARRLFGQRAALCAVALFASIGSTQYLGSLATFDAMALFLLTLSAWLVIAARDRADSTWLLMAAVAALALANAAKYATALFDPVVIALAVLTSPDGRKTGIGRGGMILGCTIGAIGGLLALGGSDYVAGLQYTTLSRTPGDQSSLVVLDDSARWIGVVLAVAALAVAAAWRRDRNLTMITAVLAIAGVLAPLNQARIHTTVSLEKHVDFGAWFACIAAGYAIAAAIRIGHRRWARIAPVLLSSVAIIVSLGAVARAQAENFMLGWPNATQLSVEVGQLARAYPGIYLAENYDVPGYYLDDQLPWQDWVSTWYFRYRAPGTRACIGGSVTASIGESSATSTAATAYTEAIAHRYFAMIILNFGDTAALDHALANTIHRDGTYHIVAELSYATSNGHGQYTVWAPTLTPGNANRGSSC
jgi:hypothetical protein